MDESSSAQRNSARSRGSRVFALVVAVGFAFCHLVTGLLVLGFLVAALSRIDGRSSPFEIAVRNASGHDVEIAPVGRSPGEPRAPTVATEAWGWSRPRASRAYVSERMRVYTLKPDAALVLECDGDAWTFDALLVREVGGVWRELDGVIRPAEIGDFVHRSITELEELPLADPSHVAFVERHRGEWQPTPLTWLLLAPALIALRAASRGLARLVGRGPRERWNLRLEFTLALCFASAALVAFCAAAGKGPAP